MITAVLLAAVVSAVPQAVTIDDALPSRWHMGDWGTPVEWQGENLYLYADPVTSRPDGRPQIARSLVVHGDQELIQPLDQIGNLDDFYWITDGTELPDGSLLVSALEVCTPGGDEYRGDWDVCREQEYTDDGWGFAIVDTDMFIVNNPLEMGSWNAAYAFGDLEDGWWDNADQIEFSDQHPGIAFRQNSYCAAFGTCYTEVWEFDLDDPSRGHKIGRLPFDSGVQVAPVQAEDGWYAVTWSWMENSSTIWHADDLFGEWTATKTTVYTHGQTHAHGLNVVDGEIIHRFSTMRNRPTFISLFDEI